MRDGSYVVPAAGWLWGVLDVEQLRRFNTTDRNHHPALIHPPNHPKPRQHPKAFDGEAFWRMSMSTELKPIGIKCCDHDYDEDGNCHIHISPGVLRNDASRWREALERLERPKCNRRACNRPHDYWFNKSTQAFYCHSCKLKIAYWPENRDLFELRLPN